MDLSGTSLLKETSVLKLSTKLSNIRLRICVELMYKLEFLLMLKSTV